MNVRNGFFLVLFLFPTVVVASLGGKSSSVENDRASLKATARASSAESSDLYSVQEMDDSGVTVREYLTKDDVVFAVTWRGIRKPDLSILLGSYYVEYQNADQARAKSVGRQPVNLKTTNIVVRRFGHMRDLRGRAYVPDLVPQGVNVEALP